MTTKEQQSIKEVRDLLSEIKSANREFMEQVNMETKKIDDKVDKKLFPVTLEQDILREAQAAIQKSIVDCLTGYNSPLTKLTNEVVGNHSDELKGLISEVLESVIRADEFKEGMREAFCHKVSRSMISEQQGMIEKISQELKNDPVFKSKLTVAIANVVDECQKR